MKRNYLCQPIDSCRTCVSIGPPGAGKSFIMLNCLYEWLEYGMFDEYILILPTYGIEQNSSYDFLKNYKNVTIYTGYHPKIAERIITQQKKDVKHKNKIFVGIDDSTQETALFKDPALVEIATCSRHLNIHLWLIMHSAKGVIPTKVRNQMAYIFLYSISPPLLEVSYKEYVSHPDFKRFRDFEEYWYEEIEPLEHGVLLLDKLHKDYDEVHKWFDSLPGKNN